MLFKVFDDLKQIHVFLNIVDDFFETSCCFKDVLRLFFQKKK